MTQEARHTLSASLMRCNSCMEIWWDDALLSVEKGGETFNACPSCEMADDLIYIDGEGGD